jgi:hypothetical protein
MKLEDFASEMVAANNFVKADFAGFAGAGKSRTMTEFVLGSYKDLGYTKPVLVIDNEKGSRFLIPKFKEAGVKALLKETTSLDDVLTSFSMLEQGDIEYIMIDSLTKVWYRYVREYLEKNKRVFMELNDWGKLLPKWQEQFSDRFVAARGSIAFTGRGGYTYDKEEDEVDERSGKTKKGSFVKSGVKMKLAGETPFEPDLNIWMEQKQEVTAEGLKIWREGQVMKDRSGLIDGMTFINPTYEHLRPFVTYLVGVPQGTVSGESSDRNLAPGENYESFDRKRKRDITLEEIQEEIVKMYPGQTVGDKKGKADLVEELFNTRSWTAVENKPMDVLEAARNTLWIKSRGHAYGAEPPPAEPPKEVVNG